MKRAAYKCRLNQEPFQISLKHIWNRSLSPGVRYIFTCCSCRIPGPLNPSLVEHIKLLVSNSRWK